MALSSLPDDLLLHIFGCLKLKERHRALPLVSRRCWQLVCSPALLHEVDLEFEVGTPAMQLRRLRSLVAFLLRRAAGSVRRLRLCYGAFQPPSDFEHECGLLVAAAFAACSGLQEAEIDTSSAVLSTWLLPLRPSLRRLRTGSSTSTLVAGDLSCLSVLEDLELGLCSDWVEFATDARLPPSITRLALGNGAAFSVLPAQVGSLTRLQHLHLRHPYDDDASLEPLGALPLRALELGGVVRSIPACLSRLTALAALTVDAGESEEGEDGVILERLSGALPHLARLSYLALCSSNSAPLAALTALRTLRCLVWQATQQDAATTLPPGGWMAGLSTLAAPRSCVAHSLPALEAARSLETLCLYDSAGNAAQLQSIVAWAARHPSLQHLQLGDDALPGHLWGEVAAASRLNPALHIQPDLFDPFLEL